MQKYVALLRGINVGGNKKVPMPELRKIFEDSGYLNVSTYINSGNVIFETDRQGAERLAKELETLLKKAFGFDIKCIMRDKKNILNLRRKIPSDWENDTEQRTDILFLSEEFNNRKSLDLIVRTTGVDNLIYISGAIVWNMRRENYSKSSMKKFIGTILYKNMTARNLNTVRKLADLMR
ncbi:DUF1697 domain-containing protein [Candidatus Falkowbacteria bacterium]|nr:DUF1697 domain-containing protein [Candidatus Falkowbacteria bacterium]